MPRLKPEINDVKTEKKPDDKSLLTRGEFIDRAGITVMEFKQLVHRNVIRREPIRGMRWAVYDAAYVDKIRHLVAQRRFLRRQIAYTPQDAMAVFTLLRDGKSLDEVFFVVGLHPKMLMEMAEDYSALQKGFFLKQAILDQINELPLEGRFPVESAEELLEVLKVAAKEKRCATCRRASISHMCMGCMEETVKKKIDAEVGKKENAAE